MAHKWPRYTHTLTLCLAALCMAGACQLAFGQDYSAGAITRTQRLHYGEYADFALKIGTAVTVLFGILRAMSEWSASGRRKRSMERANRLANFLDAVSRIPNLDRSGGSCRRRRKRRRTSWLKRQWNVTDLEFLHRGFGNCSSSTFQLDGLHTCRTSCSLPSGRS